MKIFIPTYNRAKTAVTHKIFEGFDYYYLFHNSQEAAKYPRLTKSNGHGFVTNTQIGMKSRQMKWALENLCEEDEWVLFADDNIHKLTCVNPRISKDKLVLDVQNGDQSLWRSNFSNKFSGKEFMERIVPEAIEMIERNGALHCGFAPVDNHYFRAKKWKIACPIVGKLMVFQNNKVLDIINDPIEDYTMSAQSLELFGVSLVNNWVYPVKKHYEAGGFGKVDERKDRRVKSIAYLMNKYPGLFSQMQRANGNPDIRLRIHSKEQIAAWQKNIRNVRKMKEGVW